MRRSNLSAGAFDAAIRIAVLTESTLVARRLCEMPRYVVGSPDYLNAHGIPKHPLHLARHRCLSYSYTAPSEIWHFTKGARSASVQPSGPLRVNNGDAMMPALIAGTGLGILPDFLVRDALIANRLERVLSDWSLPMGAVYWVTPPGEPQPRRIEVLANSFWRSLQGSGRAKVVQLNAPADPTRAFHSKSN